MKIELRKIKFAAFLSEETNAYSADLYVDGVLIAHVQNDGHGGCDMQHPAKGKTYDDIKRINDHIKATYPKRSYDFGEGNKGELSQDLESVCGDRLAAHLITKDLTRTLKRTVAFVKPGAKGVMTYKGKHEGVQRAHLVTETLRKYPGATILNNLPVAEALKVYQENA